MNRPYVLFVCAALLFSACDTADEGDGPAAVDPCPAAASPDQVDVFPIADGSRWEYNLEGAQNHTFADQEYRWSGTAVVKVTDASACREGKQAFSVFERIERRIEARYKYERDGNTEWRFGEERVVEQAYDWVVQDEIITRPEATWGTPPFGDSTSRFAPSRVQEIQIGRPGSVNTLILTLTAEVGPTRYSVRSVSSGGISEETWTLHRYRNGANR